MKKLKKKIVNLSISFCVIGCLILIYEASFSIGQLFVKADSRVPMRVEDSAKTTQIISSADESESKTDLVKFVATVNPSPTQTPIPMEETFSSMDVIKVNIINHTSRIGGKHVPRNVGNCHPYMAWQLISDPTTEQYRLRMEAENYDEHDFGKIDDRYAVAVKPYYGKIGDYLDVIQEDGTIIPCIIAEYKGDENVDIDGAMATYYHKDKDVVEFIVNQNAWYDADPERHVLDYHPEWNQNILVIYNVGNYWGR